MKSLADILRGIVDAGKTLDEIQRRRAVEITQWEYDELRHVFALLVLGHAVGLPAPPVEVGIGLLPFMEDDIHLMLSRLDTAHSPLSRLFSTFPAI